MSIPFIVFTCAMVFALLVAFVVACYDAKKIRDSDPFLAWAFFVVLAAAIWCAIWGLGTLDEQNQARINKAAEKAAHKESKP